jgi:hypothetical protein
MQGLSWGDVLGLGPPVEARSGTVEIGPRLDGGAASSNANTDVPVFMETQMERDDQQFAKQVAVRWAEEQSPHPTTRRKILMWVCVDP